MERVKLSQRLGEKGKILKEIKFRSTPMGRGKGFADWLEKKKK